MHLETAEELIHDITKRGDFAGVISVYLFGSVAEGRAHRQSDLDIGLLLDWIAYPTARERLM